MAQAVWGMARSLTPDRPRASLVGLTSLEEARCYGLADYFEPGDRTTVLEQVLPRPSCPEPTDPSDR